MDVTYERSFASPQSQCSDHVTCELEKKRDVVIGTTGVGLVTCLDQSGTAKLSQTPCTRIANNFECGYDLK